jgi:hypothetical protein
MQGGNFLSGAAAAFLGHIGAEGWGAAMNGAGLSEFANSTAGMIAFGVISGGVGSALTGGNFWQGAMIGGVVAGFNSAMHKIAEPGDDDPAKVRKKIVKNAKSHNGSTDWAYDVKKGRFAENSNKCNLFVDDVLQESGIYIPGPNGKLAIIGYGTPSTAGQWGDPNYGIPGWQVVTSPQAGDIVAYSTNNYSDATGHVGIMISPTESISASTVGVVRITDFGSNPSHLPSDAHYVYRRYVGLPSFNNSIGNSNFKFFGK